MFKVSLEWQLFEGNTEERALISCVKGWKRHNFEGDKLGQFCFLFFLIGGILFVYQLVSL